MQQSFAKLVASFASSSSRNRARPQHVETRFDGSFAAAGASRGGGQGRSGRSGPIHRGRACPGTVAHPLLSLRSLQPTRARQPPVPFHMTSTWASARSRPLADCHLLCAVLASAPCPALNCGLEWPFRHNTIRYCQLSNIITKYAELYEACGAQTSELLARTACRRRGRCNLCKNTKLED